MQAQKTVKYTTVLPYDCVEELKEMAKKRRIASVNQGIRQAIERFISEEKKQQYAKEMMEAAQDPDYMARTLQTQEAFAAIDAEEMKHW